MFYEIKQTHYEEKAITMKVFLGLERKIDKDDEFPVSGWRASSRKRDH